MNRQGLTMAMRNQLALDGVVIDGQAEVRLEAYEKKIAQLVYLGLSDWDKSNVSPDFEKPTKTESALRAEAMADYKFLLDCCSQARAAREAGRL